MEKKFLVFPCQIKATGDSGTFEGYGSVFGNVDEYNEIVVPGAFRQSLAEMGLPSMLWQHHSDEPMGIYTDVHEDDTGLFVRGEINLEVQKGKEAYSLLKQGALKGLSIGFRSVKREYDEETGIMRLLQLKLYEVSLVTFPANRLATVDTVKSVPTTERDFEKFLRDAGYSRNEAKRIISNGFKGTDTLRDAEVESLLSVFDKHLKGF